MTQREWGPVGRVIRIEGTIVGNLVWAPARFLPGGNCFAGAPVSTDAVLLAGCYIDPLFRGQGLGRVLIQSMAKDLIEQGSVAAVETFGSLRPRSETCVLPLDYLASVGFYTQRPHPSFPRMRMDLRSTVSWREEIGSLAERLIGAVKNRTGATATPTPSRLAVGPER